MAPQEDPDLFPRYADIVPESRPAIRVPRPPTERGFRLRDPQYPHGETPFRLSPIGVVTSGQLAGSIAFQGPSEQQLAFWDEYGAPDQEREADRTFENEVRLHG